MLSFFVTCPENAEAKNDTNGATRCQIPSSVVQRFVGDGWELAAERLQLRQRSKRRRAGVKSLLQALVGRCHEIDDENVVHRCAELQPRALSPSWPISGTSTAGHLDRRRVGARHWGGQVGSARKDGVGIAVVDAAAVDVVRPCRVGA